MPIYQMKCDNCDDTEEVIISFSQRESYACHKCHRLRRPLFSSFQTLDALKENGKVNNFEYEYRDKWGKKHEKRLSRAQIDQMNRG